MYNYIGFPEKNIVKKNITTKQFLEKANLTEAEKIKLSADLKMIKIMYSFPFPDGEINVVLAEYSVESTNRYTYNNFVRAIIRSIPNDILLIVKSEGVLVFYMSKIQANKQNDRRSTIEYIRSSFPIIPLENEITDECFLARMRRAVEISSSKKELCSKWIEYCNYGTYGEEAVVENIDWAVDKYREILERNIEFEEFLKEDTSCYSINDDEILNTESRFFEGMVLDVEEGGDVLEFIEFCKAYSRILYEEELLKDSTITDEQWVRVYIEGCNEYSLAYFNRALSDRIVYEIKTAFWSEEAGDGEYLLSSFDVDSLRECIPSLYRYQLVACSIKDF